eukprot:jgi/Galph1/2355/GphlegSOOS_G37.1
MWYLEFVPQSPIQEHAFPLRLWIGGKGSKPKTFGRKADVRLVCLNASRVHATVEVVVVDEEEKLLITDNSTYGTYVVRASNEGTFREDWDRLDVESIRKHQSARLKQGDMVAFGRPGGWYKVGRETCSIFADQLSPKQFKTVQDICEKTGMLLLSSWATNPSVFVCDELNVSPFLALALIENIPVVSFPWIDTVKDIVLCSAERVGLINQAEVAAAYTKIPATDKYFPNRSSCFTKDEVAFFQSLSALRKKICSNKKFHVNCSKDTEYWKQVVIRSGGTVTGRVGEADYMLQEEITGSCVTKAESATIILTTRELLLKLLRGHWEETIDHTHESPSPVVDTEAGLYAEIYDKEDPVLLDDAGIESSIVENKAVNGYVTNGHQEGAVKNQNGWLYTKRNAEATADKPIAGRVEIVALSNIHGNMDISDVRPFKKQQSMPLGYIRCVEVDTFGNPK